MTKIRRKEDKHLSEWFDQQKTDPVIAEIIIMTIRGDGRITFLQATQSMTTNELYFEAARAQHMIGLRNCVLGRISKLWKRCQTSYRSQYCPDKRFLPRHGLNG